MLAYDKRGIGQSGGVYPGESPTAGDHRRARPRRGGRSAVPGGAAGDRPRPASASPGHSQAGWIAPLAAAREPAIRFLVLFSGPAVTADENDLYQKLAGEGDQPPQLPTRRSTPRC